MMYVSKTPALAIVALVSVCLVACSTSTIVTDIEIVSTAVSVAAPIVAAFSGPGAAVVTKYLTAVTQGLDCLLAAAQAPGATVGSTAAAAVTCLSGAVIPALPAGTPQNIINIINAIAKEVANLLQKYGPKAMAEANLKAAAPMHLTYGDRQRIKSMRKKMDVALVTLITQK